MNRAGPGSGQAIFRYSRLKLLVLSLFIAVLAVTPLIPVLRLTVEPGTALLLSLTGLFFGGWLAAMLKRLFWRGPVLIIDETGILDRRIGSRPIPWARIEQIYPFRARSQVYIAVIPDHPGEFADPPGAFERFGLWANDAMRLPRYSISTMGLTGSTRAVMQAMAQRMPDGLRFADGPRR